MSIIETMAKAAKQARAEYIGSRTAQLMMQGGGVLKIETDEENAATVRAALAAAEAAGWVLVPKEPTVEMYCCGDERIIEAINDHSGVQRDPTPAHDCYRAMLAARPPL